MPSTARSPPPPTRPSTASTTTLGPNAMFGAGRGPSPRSAKQLALAAGGRTCSLASPRPGRGRAATTIRTTASAVGNRVGEGAGCGRSGVERRVLRVRREVARDEAASSRWPAVFGWNVPPSTMLAAVSNWTNGLIELVYWASVPHGSWPSHPAAGETNSMPAPTAASNSVALSSSWRARTSCARCARTGAGCSGSPRGRTPAPGGPGTGTGSRRRRSERSGTGCAASGRASSTFARTSTSASSAHVPEWLCRREVQVASGSSRAVRNVESRQSTCKKQCTTTFEKTTSLPPIDSVTSPTSGWTSPSSCGATTTASAPSPSCRR